MAKLGPNPLRGKFWRQGNGLYRKFIQSAWAILTNGNLKGFLTGEIYTGRSKALCLPGLNCYSCPGSLGACPMGALQAALGSARARFPFYVVGFLLAVGVLLGRLVCGFLCPFGLIQELLHRIPFVKKFKRFPGDRGLRFLKYLILLVFVMLLPLFAVDAVGTGAPWFCKLICPAGTLEGGIPLVFQNPMLQGMLGFLYTWKLGILVAVLLLSILIYRPFCKYLCPLGAIYGLLQRISVYRYRVDEGKCTRCGHCERVCPMNLDPVRECNHRECVRCGSCREKCPTGAITGGWRERPTGTGKAESESRQGALTAFTEK